MRKKAGGYFTVEAAWVLPMVLAVVGTILYLLLYQYDRCILEQDTGMLSVRVSSFTLSQEEVLGEFQRLCQGVEQEKYLIGTMAEQDISLGLGRAIVNGELQLMGLPTKAYGENTWGNMNTTYENHRYSPLFVIRSCEKVKKLLYKGEE